MQVGKDIGSGLARFPVVRDGGFPLFRTVKRLATLSTLPPFRLEPSADPESKSGHHEKLLLPPLEEPAGPGSGLITRRGQWQPGGWQNGRRGRSTLAGCKTPPVLQPGKEILDFVALAIHPLAVMDWFLAAATGRDARGDALLGQHLTDFVPVIPFISHHRGRRRQVSLAAYQQQ